MSELSLAVGLMSGTSRDGIDAALLRSDGETAVEPGAFLSVPHDLDFRAQLADAAAGKADPAVVERALTERHAAAVEALLDRHGVPRDEVRVVGFHGHTLHHDPAGRRTWQIGDGALLARLIGIDTVNDFRGADVQAGGQGAPLAPLYHAARTAGLERPLAVLNLGGVGNVTWLGPEPDDILAFDTGPGNALLDDLVFQRTGRSYDEDGALAAAGQVALDVLAELLNHSFFDVPPPKSLDRDAFDPAPVARLATEDAAATLATFTAGAVARALPHLPAPPRRWMVAGGGRHNPVILHRLRQALGVPVEPVESVGWNGDAIEAEAFAYLALRSLRGLPLSLPVTTGVPAPMPGGRHHPAARGGRD